MLSGDYSQLVKQLVALVNECTLESHSYPLEAAASGRVAVSQLVQQCRGRLAQYACQQAQPAGWPIQSMPRCLAFPCLTLHCLLLQCWTAASWEIPLRLAYSTQPRLTGSGNAHFSNCACRMPICRCKSGRMSRMPNYSGVTSLLQYTKTSTILKEMTKSVWTAWSDA